MTKEHIPYFQILALHNAEWLIVLLTEKKKNVCASSIFSLEDVLKLKICLIVFLPFGIIKC